MKRRCEGGGGREGEETWPGALLLGVCGDVTPPKQIVKNRENSGKLRENSVTSDNICGC